MIREAWRRFCKYLPFLGELVKRDFKTKYKRSILGVLWSVLHPLIIMIVLNIVFSSLFKLDIENFPLYLICGQIIFNFFNESTSMALSSVIGNASIINRVYVPCYMFPLSRVVSSLVNVSLSLVALGIVFLATGAKPSITMLSMPVPILYTFFFSCGIGLLLSAGMVFFRDLTYLYGIVTTILMYLTPIFYPESIIPQQALPLFRLNPIYHFVKMFRNVMLYHTWPSLADHQICLTACAISLMVGTTYFHRNQNRFILHI